MERVAEPLRAMGAVVTTTDGHAPLEVVGGPLYGIVATLPVPTAQVKSAILLAGVAAEGETTVTEPAATRDHTERALAALGAPVSVEGRTVTLQGVFQHDAFTGTVPGDVSSAAFLVAAAALNGSELTVREVGLNPSRLHFLRVLERMGVRTETRPIRQELGEPVGDLWVAPGADLLGTVIEASELPLVIDEVPILAVVAAHARGETWFTGAAELRAKETDRLTGVAEGLRTLGGHAGIEGDDLVVPGLGLRGGIADSGGDHRLAMAFAVGALAADGAERDRGHGGGRRIVPRVRRRHPGARRVRGGCDVTRLNVIAIDGAAGSGKSTLARGLAEALGLPYVNTGIMYRALTLAALDEGVDPDDGAALARLMSRLRFSLSTGVPAEIEVEGSAPSAALESDRVEGEVSHVARHPEVRALMREGQRALGLPGAVVEGRDIGSVVFPDAPVKLFLTAEPDKRGERRAEQRGVADPEEVEVALLRRDTKDANVNPFEPADDAIVLDTSDRTVDDTLRDAIAIVRDRMPELFA